MVAQDDDSKNKELNDLADSIYRKERFYYENWGWLGQKGRLELLDTIYKLQFNYNTIIEKRDRRVHPNRIRDLCVPGPMPEAEKLALIQLIESS